MTKRVGRYLRLLAGRPPVVPSYAGRPREQYIVASPPDSAIGPPAAATTLTPPPSPPLHLPEPAPRPGPAGPASNTLAPRLSPAAPAAAADGTASTTYLAARPALRGRLAASGALFGMLLLCLITCLVAAWRQIDVLAGLGFCAGCVLAPVYARRSAQLRVAVSTPVVFLVAEIAAQSLTATGSSGRGAVLPVIEGTFLTLADIAPWLFAGTAVCIVIAMFRGLPQCVRDLRAGSAVRSGGRAGLGVPAGPALRGQRSQRS